MVNSVGDRKTEMMKSKRLIKKNVSRRQIAAFDIDRNVKENKMNLYENFV